MRRRPLRPAHRLDAAVNKYRLAHEEAKRALSWDEKSVADVQSGARSLWADAARAGGSAHLGRLIFPAELARALTHSVALPRSSDAEGDQRLKKMQKQMEVFRLELVKMEESQRIEEMNKRRIATRLAELAEVKKKLAAHFAAQRAPPRNTAGVNINLARDAPEPIALMTVARGIVIEAAEFESHSSLRRGGCDHESATCVSREDRMAHGRWSSGAMANYLR